MTDPKTECLKLDAATAGTPASIDLSAIRLDAGTQSRREIYPHNVDEYAERMKAGERFPPVILFHDGTDYFMADGFHRAKAAAAVGGNTIDAIVHKGTRLDALKFSLGSNCVHGVRRNRQDIIQAICLAVAAFPDSSDRAIAKMCVVGHPYVAQIRREYCDPPQLESDSSSTKPQVRVGLDGKKRKLPVRKPKAKSPATPDAAPAAAGKRGLFDDEGTMKSADQEAGTTLTPEESRERDALEAKIEAAIEPMKLARQFVDPLSLIQLDNPKSKDALTLVRRSLYEEDTRSDNALDVTREILTRTSWLCDWLAKQRVPKESREDVRGWIKDKAAMLVSAGDAATGKGEYKFA